MIPVNQNYLTNYTKFNYSDTLVDKKTPQTEDNKSNEKVSLAETASQAYASNNSHPSNQPARKKPQFPEELVISPIISNKRPSDLYQQEPEATYSNKRNEIDSISSQFQKTYLDENEKKETNQNPTDKASQTVINPSGFHVPSASKTLEMNIKTEIPYSPVNQNDIELSKILREITLESNENPPSIWSETPSQEELNIFIDLVSSKYGIRFPTKSKDLIFERFSLIELDRGKLAIMYNILNRYISLTEKIKQNNKPEEQVELYYNIAAAAFWAHSYQEDVSFQLQDIALYFGVGYLHDIKNCHEKFKLMKAYEKQINFIKNLIKNADPKQTDLIKEYETSIKTYEKFIIELNIKPLINILRNHFESMFYSLKGKAIDSRNLNGIQNLEELTNSVLNDYKIEIYQPAKNLGSQLQTIS